MHIDALKMRNKHVPMWGQGFCARRKSSLQWAGHPALKGGGHTSLGDGTQADAFILIMHNYSGSD